MIKFLVNSCFIALILTFIPSLNQSMSFDDIIQPYHESGCNQTEQLYDFCYDGRNATLENDDRKSRVFCCTAMATITCMNKVCQNNIKTTDLFDDCQDYHLWSFSCLNIAHAAFVWVLGTIIAICIGCGAAFGYYRYKKRTSVNVTQE